MTTISHEQLKYNRELHANRPDFGSKGGAGHQSLVVLLKRYQELGLIHSVLDYGTGKGLFPKKLATHLPGLSVTGYDPAVDEFASRPSSPSDLLTCLDVLEHVDRQSVVSVLSDIQSLTSKLVYLQIDIQPAVKRLSSGCNAHIMLAPPDWWLSQISLFFPYLGSFPIYHESGIQQKVGIVASSSSKSASLVWSFLMKLQQSPMTIVGGYLGASKVKKE